MMEISLQSEENKEMRKEKTKLTILMDDNVGSKSFSSSYYESFENFLQNLAPVKLSHESENFKNPFTLDIHSEEVIESKATTMESSHREEKGESKGGTQEDEIKHLQELVQLLKIRLDALQRVLEIQEQEVCKDMINVGEEKTSHAYEKLLTRWRREVCVMLLKQRVDALQVEQRQLQHTQKEQHLTVQLHEARALVEVLKQKERNSQAKFDILTTSTKVTEMTMRAEQARRQHELEGMLKEAAKTTSEAEAISHILESHYDVLLCQMERVSNASCRLDLYGKRLFFAEHQVAMATGLISSEEQSQGVVLCQRKGDMENTPTNILRKKDHAIIDQRIVMDQVGRANQLEELLASTKTQLASECLHARELQERLVKSDIEARDSSKKAIKKVQEQADRDLVAIKRKHGLAMQSLQQKLAKMQADQAKTIVAHHQLERKLSQQQQEFTQTMNQRDIEFKKSLDAKEIEVNTLLDEQNVLLAKLKNFWRPILNSSSAKIFSEKNVRSTPTRCETVTSEGSTSQEVNSNLLIKHNITCLRSVETQTPDLVGNKKHHDSKTFIDDTHQNSSYESMDQEKETPSKIKEKIVLCRRVSTPTRKIRQNFRPKKNDEDLITSYLAKLQKAYVKSASELSPHFLSNQSIDSLICKVREKESLPGSSLPKLSPMLSEGGTMTGAKHTPNSSLDFKESLDCDVDPRESLDSNEVKLENVPQYVIYVPHRETFKTSGNSFFLNTRRRKMLSNSNRLLRAKLHNLEDLSESLLSKSYH